VSENARAVMGLPGGGVAPGGPGDLVAVAGGSLQEALSTTTEDRIVFRAGDVVRRTRVMPEQPLNLGGSDA
jgi:cytosine deaminase